MKQANFQCNTTNKHSVSTNRNMGLCLMRPARRDSSSTDSSVYDGDSVADSSASVTSINERKLKKEKVRQYLKTQQHHNRNKNRQKKDKDTKFNHWRGSELAAIAHRKERRAKKANFRFHAYEVDELRKGTICYEARRGLFKRELEELCEAKADLPNRERKARRLRRMQESFDWTLGF